MVCGTADILMKFLSLGWFGLGYDCFCKRLHSRKLIGKASSKEAGLHSARLLSFAGMLGVEVLVCLIAMAQASSLVLPKVTTHGLVVLFLTTISHSINRHGAIFHRWLRWRCIIEVIGVSQLLPWT